MVSKPSYCPRSYSNLGIIWRHVGQKRMQISDWISQVDYYSQYREMRTRLLPGTGQWFLDRAEYVEWAESSESSLLWLRGNGKISMLDIFLRLHNILYHSWNWEDKPSVSIGSGQYSKFPS